MYTYVGFHKISLNIVLFLLAAVSSSSQVFKFNATSSSSSKRHREKTAFERRKSYNAQGSKKKPPNYKPYTGKAMPMYEMAPS